MGKTRRRFGTAKMRDKQNPTKISAPEGANRLITTTEMKQEPNIKQELLPFDDLVNIPARDNRGNGQPSVDLVEYDCEDDDVDEDVSIDDIKFEVKEECGEKKEEETNPNAADDDAMNKQQDQISAKHDAKNLPLNRNKNVSKKEVKKSKIDAEAKGKATKQHKCGQCEYATEYKSNLKKHLLKHTGAKPFPCERCTKEFKWKESLRIHRKVHIDEFLFHCSGCLRGFNHKNEKTQHESNCTIRCYECFLCNKSFGTKKLNLIRHLRIHSGEKPFACIECPRKFKQKGHLEEHMKVHYGRAFHCSKCRSGFTLHNDMVAHEQKCTRRTYECHICGKFIGLCKNHLKDHMQTHSRDKLFKCNKCSKKFTQKTSLRHHMKIHSRSLKLKCVICRQGFSNESQWKAHQRSCDKRNYECHLCKKFCRSKKSNLIKHMLKHTGEKPFRCEICQNRFTQKSNVTRHISNIHNRKH